MEPDPCQYLSLRVPRIPGQDEHLYRTPWCTPWILPQGLPIHSFSCQEWGLPMAHSSSLSWIRPLLKEAASPKVTLLHGAAHTNDESSNLASIRQFWMAIPAPSPHGTSLWDNSTIVQLLPRPNPASLASFQKFWEPLPAPIPNKPPAMTLQVRVYFLGKQPMKISKTNEHKVIPMVTNSSRSLPTHRVEWSSWVDGPGGLFWSISSLKVKSSSAFTLFQNLSFQSPS